MHALAALTGAESADMHRGYHIYLCGMRLSQSDERSHILPQPAGNGGAAAAAAAGVCAHPALVGHFEAEELAVSCHIQGLVRFFGGFQDVCVLPAQDLCIQQRHHAQGGIFQLPLDLPCPLWVRDQGRWLYCRAAAQHSAWRP